MNHAAVQERFHLVTSRRLDDSSIRRVPDIDDGAVFRRSGWLPAHAVVKTVGAQGWITPGAQPDFGRTMAEQPLFGSLQERSASAASLMFGPDKKSENGAFSLVGHGEADRLAINLADPGFRVRRQHASDTFSRDPNRRKLFTRLMVFQNTGSDVEKEFDIVFTRIPHP
jgi:hypothetical protein